jgi:hypothetical protein
MKTFLITCLTFFSALSLTPDDKQRMIKSIKEKQEWGIDEQQLNVILITLNHPYFKDRFTNFKKILGAGNDGVVFEVDFQMLSDYPQTIPVALKIDFPRPNLEMGKSIENYLNFMVNPQDHLKNYVGEDLLVFNLSPHYEKMLREETDFKMNPTFISMIYEAAIISFKETENGSEHFNYVSVTVTQVGFAGVLDDFLPNPADSSETMSQNSLNVAKMIVQICYGLWQIYEKGFIHSDNHLQNMMVVGNFQNFTPLFMGLDNLQTADDLLSSGFPLKKEMLDKVDSNYSEFVKYTKDPKYFIVDESLESRFKLTAHIPITVFTSDWQEKLEDFLPQPYLVNIKYNNDFINVIRFLKKILLFYIDNKLVDRNHVNLKKVTKTVDSIYRKLGDKYEYLTSEELFKKFNRESGLNLREFHSENQDLEDYLMKIRKEIELRSKSGVPGMTTGVSDLNHDEERIILV